MKGKPLLAVTVLSLIGAAAATYATPRSPACRPGDRPLGHPFQARRGGNRALRRIDLRPVGGIRPHSHQPGLCRQQQQEPRPAQSSAQGPDHSARFPRSNDGWEGGSIYNPEDGGTYKATITIADADTLKLKGCIVWPLCKTQTWKRLR
jgi:hypothetical protein